MTNQFDDDRPVMNPRLKKLVWESSDATSDIDTPHQWAVVRLDEDIRAEGVCLCGHTGLRYLYTIENRVTGETLRPIGSECINLFDREDMVRESKILKSFSHIKDVPFGDQNFAYFKNEGLLSRRLIDYIEEKGPGFLQEEMPFLRKMFNSPGKMSFGQGRKADQLVVDMVSWVQYRFRAK